MALTPIALPFHCVVPRNNLRDTVAVSFRVELAFADPAQADNFAQAGKVIQPSPGRFARTFAFVSGLLLYVTC